MANYIINQGRIYDIIIHTEPYLDEAGKEKPVSFIDAGYYEEDRALIRPEIASRPERESAAAFFSENLGMI